MPAKQSKRGRLWLNNGSSVRLRPEYPNRAWSDDFVHERTNDGRAFRTLNILGKFTRQCLMIRVRRKLTAIDLIDAQPNESNTPTSMQVWARGEAASVRVEAGRKINRRDTTVGRLTSLYGVNRTTGWRSGIAKLNFD